MWCRGNNYYAISEVPYSSMPKRVFVLNHLYENGLLALQVQSDANQTRVHMHEESF